MTVTRFAPSPTGYLHIGGARTALFNWLLARKSGGKFLLRIEDTDQKRNTPTAMKQVMEDLKWLGITWDEGPETGGPNGPYLQSERRDIYDRYMQKLLDEGKAYYCFDTPEELAAMRQDAEGKQSGFIYRRPETLPTAADVEKAKAEGKPVTVRFAVPQDKPIIVKDIVRGEVKFAPEEIADFIIQKSDGFPTYHFAVVVDDALMGITHVMRGQEHLMNTPGHIALQQALGFDTPVYAHMSITVSDNGGKLSKRERPNTLRKAIRQLADANMEEIAKAGGISEEDLQSFMKKKTTPDETAIEKMADFIGITLPEINVVDFAKSGYIPEALVNFTALLGWNPGDDREIMSVDELIEAFDVNRLNKANSFFDRNKLISFNTEHINKTDVNILLRHFKHYLELNNSPMLSADDDLLARLINMNRGAKTFVDIENKCKLFFISCEQIEYDNKAVKKVFLKNEGQGIEMLKFLKPNLENLEDFSGESIEALLRKLAEEKETGLGNIAQPIRVAVSGTTISPAIFDSISILGKEETIARIDKAISTFS
ncbi:MAG: glutamate--tRNA ligase [Sedimentisphaeraceae bacterium JB056]